MYDDPDEVYESYYDVALVCLNGHSVNASSRDLPQHNQAFCDKCGSRTIDKCPHCETPLRGRYNSPGSLDLSDHVPAAYCRNCGKPFPWTENALAAAADLVDVLEGLSKEERAELRKALPDLLSDTARTPIAETRFKRILKKAGKDGYDAMKSILVNVVTEAVRKQTFGV